MLARRAGVTSPRAAWGDFRRLVQLLHKRDELRVLADAVEVAVLLKFGDGLRIEVATAFGFRKESEGFVHEGITVFFDGRNTERENTRGVVAFVVAGLLLLLGPRGESLGRGDGIGGLFAMKQSVHAKGEQAGNLRGNGAVFNSTKRN